MFNEVKFEDICAIGDGAHSSIKRKDSGILYLTAKNFKTNGLDLSSVDFISEADFAKHFSRSKSKVKKPIEDDLLFSIIGSIGTPYLVKNTDFFGLSSSVAILRPNTDIVFPKYLYFWMCSAPFQTIVHSIKSGVAQGFLSLGMIKKLPALIPSLPTQKKIAAVLSAYDDLIENNTRRIALLERMAEELYKEWFVRMRFPGHESARFEKGIPEGWEPVKIENAFKFLGGGTPSKNEPSYWNDGDINWFTPSDLTSSKSMFAYESELKCNQDGLSKSSAKLFPPYSIMMTSRATIGVFAINTTEACTNQGFITSIPNKDFPLFYLYHWLKASKEHFLMLSSGATFAELTKGNFKKIEIMKPASSVVEQFETMVSPMYKTVENLQKSNQILKTTRDRLLTRLISGKISVEDLDIAFPPSMQDEAPLNPEQLSLPLESAVNA